MIIISNHLIQRGLIKPAESMTIRVNLAWVKDEPDLEKYLNVPHDIFLDYPHGRLKAPASKFNVLESIEIANTFKNVTHYAMSNAEDRDMILMLRSLVRNDVVVVPKIETLKGVCNLESILMAAQAKTIMLDKEDLSISAGNRKTYETAVGDVRTCCKSKQVQILELAGVVFSS